MISIIGMGTGERDSLTLGAIEAARQAARLVLQTGTVDAAEYFRENGIAFETLDEIYAGAEDFDELIQRSLMFIGCAEGTVFAVLGSPGMNGVAAALMKNGAYADAAGLSAGEKAAAKTGVTGGAVQYFTAQELAAGMRFSSSLPLVVTEVDSPMAAADVSLALLEAYSADHEAGAYIGGRAFKVPMKGLAALTGWDYSAAVTVMPEPPHNKERYDFYDLVGILAMLRAEGGCPWDREQTHDTLRPYLLEEAYEVMDAIDRKDPFMLADELGDVLMQVAFHAEIGAEFSEFDIDDVTTDICKKMISRHTHIFGTAHAETARDVAGNWEEIKRREKGQQSYADALRDVPRCMSQLIRSQKIQKKAGLLGFDWDDCEGPAAKVREELAELMDDVHAGRPAEAESGDLLFAVTNLLRFLKVSPDAALNGTCNRFIERFSYMEDTAKKSGRDLKEMSLDEQEELWQEAKKAKNDIENH